MTTDNLLKALKTIYTAIDKDAAAPLWGKGEKILLWADAICINQSDPEEKSFQVPLMSEIYQNAKGTVGYVGAHRQHQDPHRAFRATIRVSGARFMSYSMEDLNIGNDGEDNGAGDFFSSQWFLRS